MIWQKFVFKTTAVKINNAVLLTCLSTKDNDTDTFRMIQQMLKMPKMCNFDDIWGYCVLSIVKPQECATHSKITFKTWPINASAKNRQKLLHTNDNVLLLKYITFYNDGWLLKVSNGVK